MSFECAGGAATSRARACHISMRMRRSGIFRGRIGLVALGVAASICPSLTGTAWAAQQPVVAGDAGGGAVNSYSAPNYTMDQGEFLQFQNVGPSNEHDVWSRANGPDGKKLFISPTINPGNTTTVAGTQFLTTGTYPFFCNVHPFEMTGDLIVTANGQPQPRPRIDVTVVSGKLDKVAKKGKLAIKVEALSNAQNISLEATLGKFVLGRIPDLDVAAGQTRKATVKLSKSGRSKLAKKEKATVKVRGTPAFGSPDTAKRKLT